MEVYTPPSSLRVKGKGDDRLMFFCFFYLENTIAGSGALSPPAAEGAGRGAREEESESDGGGMES